MLFENNPLTTVCSLVCNHENQCEGHCVRGIKGAPVHFSVIENYISSTYASQMTQGPAPSNGKKAAIIGVIVATCLETLFTVTAPWTMRLFTDNPDMVHIVTRLLAIDIILEVGRVTNLVYGQALKTSGDAVFPAVIAAVFMYVCAVGGTWMFGLHLGLLATGAYIGLTCDECVRAVGMVLRWRSGKWTEKKLV